MRIPGSARTAAVLAAAVLLAAGGLGWALVGDDGGLEAGSVLRFEDTLLTEEDLEARVEVLSALYGVERPEGQNAEDFDRAAAKSAAVALVLDADAEERGLEVSQKEVNDQLDALIEQQLVGGREEFVQFLATVGLSEQDVLDEIERQMLTAGLVQEVTADVPEPTEADARAAYDENRDRMATPETRRLRNIVVGSRAEAARVLRAAQRGQSFTELVQIWSRDQSTREAGGNLGTVSAMQLEDSYAEAAFTAREGEVFGPVQTRFGWNVGLVVEVEPSTPLGFDDVREQLLEELYSHDRLAVWRDYLGGLLEEADVQYAGRFRPDDPTAPPAELPEERTP